MRNPWGVDGDYKGVWCDNAKISNLTLEYATQLNYTRNLTDGIFFIPVADFKLYFPDLVISTYYESWVNSVYT